MSMDKRMAGIEDSNLTPREAMILWMREAHQFNSLVDYGNWLLEQPDECYPLIRMPAQVVATVRARNKGRKDDELRGDFYQVQKDVLFFHHIHKEVNLRAAMNDEARLLKLRLATATLRTLVNEVHDVDQARLRDFQFPEDLSKPLPPRTKTDREFALEERLSSWATETAAVADEVASFREASSILSRRYFAGEELLFPDTVRKLEATLRALAGPREVYGEVIRDRHPESDEDFIRWLARSEKGKVAAPVAPFPALEQEPKDDSLVIATARGIARHVLVMARAAALDDLGERDASVQVAQDWMRSESRGR